MEASFQQLRMVHENIVGQLKEGLKEQHNRANTALTIVQRDARLQLDVLGLLGHVDAGLVGADDVRVDAAAAVVAELGLMSKATLAAPFMLDLFNQK